MWNMKWRNQYWNVFVWKKSRNQVLEFECKFSLQLLGSALKVSLCTSTACAWWQLSSVHSHVIKCFMLGSVDITILSWCPFWCITCSDWHDVCARLGSRVDQSRGPVGRVLSTMQSRWSPGSMAPSLYSSTFLEYVDFLSIPNHSPHTDVRCLSRSSFSWCSLRVLYHARAVTWMLSHGRCHMRTSTNQDELNL